MILQALRIVSIGTIEPRKNFPAAVKICAALSRRLGREVELHIIGRVGWGVDINSLRQPNVILHGYVEDARARTIIEASDLLLCTSRAEGLCLPLIEAQYSGMPVVAPNERVFREVLGVSGILLEFGFAGARGGSNCRRHYYAFLAVSLCNRLRGKHHEVE